jgi:hypothetical protein
MNYLVLILLFGFVSCGKTAKSSNQANTINTIGADSEIHDDDLTRLLSFDQKSVVAIGFEIQKIAKNYPDYQQYLKALDNVLSIRCHEVCTIRRKK